MCQESELWITAGDLTDWSSCLFPHLVEGGYKIFCKNVFSWRIVLQYMDWRLWKVWCLKWWESQPRAGLAKTTAEFLFSFLVYFRVISRTLQISICPSGLDLGDGTVNICVVQMSFLFLQQFWCRVISVFKDSRYLQFQGKAWDLLSQMHHISRLEEQLGGFSHSWGNKGLSWTFFMESTFGWIFVVCIHAWLPKWTKWMHNWITFLFSLWAVWFFKNNFSRC